MHLPTLLNLDKVFGYDCVLQLMYESQLFFSYSVRADDIFVHIFLERCHRHPLNYSFFGSKLIQDIYFEASQNKRRKHAVLNSSSGRVSTELVRR